MRKYDIRTTCTNSNNTDKILTNNEDKSDNNSKSGIYCINCDQCNAMYYGQTDTNIGVPAVEIIGLNIN